MTMIVMTTYVCLQNEQTGLARLIRYRERRQGKANRSYSINTLHDWLVVGVGTALRELLLMTIDLQLSSFQSD
jgi:hypothetical protein